MTPEKLAKHKQHCDMHNCERCKLPSGDERERLADKIMEVTGEWKAVYWQIVDFILADRAATKRQLLEELEAEGPEARHPDFSKYYPTANGGITNATTANQQDKGFNQANAKWRTLIQQKKGKL